MLFYMCLSRLGTLTTNAQGYLRIPIGVGLSVLLLGETVPANLALGLVLVMAGVAAMTIPADRYGKWIEPAPFPVSRIANPASYCRLTSVRSTNQDCGETNPLIFGLIARGLRSWTIKSQGGLSTRRSCALR